MTPAMLRTAHRDRARVLLVFDDNDASRPIIVGIINTPLQIADECVLGLDPNSQPHAADGARDEPVGVPGARLGRISGIDAHGVLLQLDDVPGQHRARTAITLGNLKEPVVVIQCADRSLVIIGQIQTTVPVALNAGQGADVLLKGSSVRIEADVELILKTGTCTVQLDARGKALITADRIVSRARESNKVQGGSVQLN
jgi:hypothetical protein